MASKRRGPAIVLSTQELAERIQAQCEAAFDRLNDLSAAHSRLDDESTLDEALDAAEEMDDQAWEVRLLIADIRAMAEAIARWAADPSTD